MLFSGKIKTHQLEALPGLVGIKIFKGTNSCEILDVLIGFQG